MVGGCSGCYGSGGGAAQGGGGAGTGAGGGGAGRAPERVGRPRADAPVNEAERQAIEDLLRRMRDQKKRERKRDDDQVSTTARVVVKLPAEARLWVDQAPCPLEGTERAFNTPALEPGQRYVYTLRVELDRDGRRAEETRRVPLVAGQRVEVNFENIGAVRTAAN